MFLIALTKDVIAQNFQSVKVEDFNIHGLKLTFVLDNFLSDFTSDADVFSIIESPLIKFDSYQKTIFSQITYQDKNDTLNVFKSTISGRPIYYHINPKGEFFCSTHISMLRAAGVPIVENTDVLPEFFVFRHIMPPNTLYKNIYEMLSGGQLQIKIIDNRCKIQSINYYNPPAENQNLKSLNDCSIKLLDNLSESIKKLHKVKDETAILLSGGIDSSILSSLCKTNLITDNSYSTKYPFEEPNLDLEKKYALSAAQALGMKHQVYEPTNKEYLTGFLEAVSYAEEPLHQLQSILIHLLLKNGIQSDKKIIINGWGAGTTFGSNKFLYIHNNPLIQKISIPSIGVLDTLSRTSKRFKLFLEILNSYNLKTSLADPKNLIWHWMDYGNKDWVCTHFKTTENDIIKKRYNFIKNFQNMSIYDIWSLYSFFSDEQYTLSIWTKIGEGNKKIMYTPFYDQDVLNYVFSIPWKLKLQSPENRLRKEIAQKTHIPDFIINRPKISLGVQSKHWAEKDDIFEPIIPLTLKIFDEKEIRKMQSAEKHNAMTFWNILNYSIWKRLCINNEPLAVLLEELNESI
jgi:asparagine synthase (glutamine-hydrolysing)